MNEVTTIRLGTSERDGTFWSEGEAIASLLQKDMGMRADILAAEHASIENARRLDAGLVELGFMASNWIGRAFRGETPFDDPIALRMVAPANSGAMFFITRADSDLRTVGDLAGRRVAIGPEGSGMVQHIHTIFGVLGIGFGDFEPAYLSFEEGAAALRAGEVDAQWQCPYPNRVMQNLSETCDVRVLSYPRDALQQVLSAIDHYRPAVMPAGFFRGVDADSDQLAVVNVIAAHERTDAEAVRKVVHTMLTNFEELARLNGLFRGLADLFEPLRSEGQAALEFGGVPLHPGAVQAYRDAGYLS
jgi:TRAP transporter TAXI family solute receptor